MRKLVGLILITVALVVGLKTVKTKLLLTKVQASSRPVEVISLEAGGFEPEQSYSCAQTNQKLVFRLASDKLMYNVYLIAAPGKETKLVNQAWAANVLTVVWNKDCSRVGYSTGTASLGFWVTLVDTKTNKEVTSIDLRNEFLGAIGAGALTYSHIYTGVYEWKTGDEVVLKVWGRPDSDTVAPQEVYFLVNAASGKVIRKVI